MKLVVNASLSFLIEGVAEALKLGSRLGVGPAGLDELIEGGPLSTAGDHGDPQRQTSGAA
jgi:3-hydroxyisobutyrate dehydrogenase